MAAVGWRTSLWVAGIQTQDCEIREHTGFGWGMSAPFHGVPQGRSKALSFMEADSICLIKSFSNIQDPSGRRERGMRKLVFLLNVVKTIHMVRV